MTTTIREITYQDCRTVLGRSNVARLACARDNQPYIVPVHVDLEGEYLYAYATLGQKIHWMRDNPLVCLEVEELGEHGHWTTVVVRGRYEELPPAAGVEELRCTALRLFQRHAVWWEPASVPLAEQPQRPPVVFRIAMIEVTGRHAERAPQHHPAEGLTSSPAE